MLKPVNCTNLGIGVPTFSFASPLLKGSCERTMLNLKFFTSGSTFTSASTCRNNPSAWAKMAFASNIAIDSKDSYWTLEGVEWLDAISSTQRGIMPLAIAAQHPEASILESETTPLTRYVISDTLEQHVAKRYAVSALNVYVSHAFSSWPFASKCHLI